VTRNFVDAGDADLDFFDAADADPEEDVRRSMGGGSVGKESRLIAPNEDARRSVGRVGGGMPGGSSLAMATLAEGFDRRLNKPGDTRLGEPADGQPEGWSSLTTRLSFGEKVGEPSPRRPWRERLLIVNCFLNVVVFGSSSLEVRDLDLVIEPSRDALRLGGRGSNFEVGPERSASRTRCDDGLSSLTRGVLRGGLAGPKGRMSDSTRLTPPVCFVGADLMSTFRSELNRCSPTISLCSTSSEILVFSSVE
jgi:hypothetical protein